MNKPKKVAFYTLGCKVNQYETNVMMNMFEKKGYEIVDFHEVADVYVINTCTVTNMSDRKSRQMLRRAKQKNPNSILCAVGCYAQVAKEELAKMEEIDIILGTAEKREICEKVEEYDAKEKVIAVDSIMKLHPYETYPGVAYSKHARAEIKIQDGCDRFCSYCLIPYARGPVRSRNPEEILEEIQKILQKGAKEIVLTGIHISSYGKDFPEKKPTLIDLLEQIQQIKGIQRIRLGSLEPRIVTDDFVHRLQALPSVCHHFHLSLQSGCDETLQRMNRKYTTEEFRAIVTRLRKAMPDVALTTDVIVGFPGETEEEFAQTKAFLEEIQFSKMHIFPYSKRKGTLAATYPNQVSEEKKEERSNCLISLSNRFEKAFAEAYLGKPVEVLFENETEGHTGNYIKVIRKQIGTPNEFQTVIPTSWQGDALLVEEKTPLSKKR